MGANELSMQLWRDRELLEMLLFKLEEQRLLLEDGSMRWIHLASREIEQVVEQLRTSGVSRAVAVADLAREWRTAEDAGLATLIAAAPTPAWRDVFVEHQAALTGVVAEISALKHANEVHLRTASRAVEEVLAGLDGASGEYTTTGERAREDSARLVDREI